MRYPSQSQMHGSGVFHGWGQDENYITYLSGESQSQMHGSGVFHVVFILSPSPSLLSVAIPNAWEWGFSRCRPSEMPALNLLGSRNPKCMGVGFFTLREKGLQGWGWAEVAIPNAWEWGFSRKSMKASDRIWLLASQSQMHGSGVFHKEVSLCVVSKFRVVVAIPNAWEWGFSH